MLSFSTPLVAKGLINAEKGGARRGGEIEVGVERQREKERKKRVREEGKGRVSMPEQTQPGWWLH